MLYLEYVEYYEKPDSHNLKFNTRYELELYLRELKKKPVRIKYWVFDNDNFLRGGEL